MDFEAIGADAPTRGCSQHKFGSAHGCLLDSLAEAKHLHHDADFCLVREMECESCVGDFRCGFPMDGFVIGFAPNSFSGGAGGLDMCF